MTAALSHRRRAIANLVGRRLEAPTRTHLLASLRATVVSLAAIGIATAAVAVLESPAVGISDPSPLYLVAVVAVGILHGTRAALGTAVAAFAVYDVLFTEPRFTFTVADPREWLDLVLLLFVALVIGRLTARETERAHEATQRARESEALFAISRTLATTPSVSDAAALIVARLAEETRMARLWIGVRSRTGESVLADSAPRESIPLPGSVGRLSRAPGDGAARWIAIHDIRPGGRPEIAVDVAVWGAPLEAEGSELGTLWGLRRRALGTPGREETRLLSLAADQLALALRREQLSREATEVEIARRSDALKTALLDSVSHELRTPLSRIRAIAGSLIDPALDWRADEQRAAGRAIDSEADRLSELVQNVLDLGRIEGGALRPELEVFDVEDLVEPVVSRMAQLGDGRHIAVRLGNLPPVRADGVLFDTALANLLENAIRHAGPDAPIEVRGATRSGWVELSVEDGGVGVPDDALSRLFGKFYRVPGRVPGPRPGLGIGLSIVRGFVQAIGGEVAAQRSELGGLAVLVRLPVGPEPPNE